LQIKSFISLLFFLPIILCANSIWQKNEWKALLHYDEKFYIDDKNFYLSKKRDLKSEFIATIKAFKKHPYFQCKFPARKLFIENELNITFPKAKCKEFEEYKKKAPAEEIYLVFASENIKNPSSMMGHTFFKIVGHTNSREVAHAITFYTVIENNPIKLIEQNIYSGMKGFFSLKPYWKILNNYLNIEKRSIWEFKLKLNNYRKKLIYYHFWELKDIKMKYYFTSYNCADVVFYSLILAKPNIQKKLWNTPLSVIHTAKLYNLIEKINFIPTDEYLIKILEEDLSYKDLLDIKNFINNPNNKSNYNQWSSAKLLLLQTYIKYLYKNSKLTNIRYYRLKKDIQKQLKSTQINIYNYKSPLNIPKERSLAIALKNINHQNFLKLSFLPASHLLSDDNRDYSGENELKLFYISILINNRKIILDEFSIYSIYALVPYDPLLNLLSYRFSLAIKQLQRTTFILDGGIGKNFKFSDINLYLFINFGFWYDKKFSFYGVTYPEIGLLINEIFNMKSYFYYKYIITSSNEKYPIYGLTHSFFLSKNKKLFINYEKINKNNQIEFGYEIKF